MQALTVRAGYLGGASRVMISAGYTFTKTGTQLLYESITGQGGQYGRIPVRSWCVARREGTERPWKFKMKLHILESV